MHLFEFSFNSMSISYEGNAIFILQLLAARKRQERLSLEAQFILFLQPKTFLSFDA
jgi:hypothetical protein